VVDTKLDRPAQTGKCLVVVARRAEHPGPGQLHRPEADPAYRPGAERE
jgi:hypothetical protein